MLRLINFDLLTSGFGTIFYSRLHTLLHPELSVKSLSVVASWYPLWVHKETLAVPIIKEVVPPLYIVDKVVVESDVVIWGWNRSACVNHPSEEGAAWWYDLCGK